MDDLFAYLPKSFGKRRHEDSDDDEEERERKQDQVIQASPVGSVGHSLEMMKRPKTYTTTTTTLQKGRPLQDQGSAPDAGVQEQGTSGGGDGGSDIKKEEKEKGEDDGLDDIDDNEDDLTSLLPLTHEASLKDHDKPITALTIDRAGMRMATGSYDYMVKCWDFGGMDSRLRPFRTFEPKDGHQVRDLVYSGTGDRLLVAPNGNQAKIYDRDGKELFECVRGDMYLRDMRHTKGHVSALTGCCWHPLDRNAFFTSSLDGTARLWDVHDKRSHRAIMVHNSRSPGGRIGITSMDVHPEGTHLLTGSNDGSISLWNPNGSFHRPIQVIPKAHTKGEDLTCVSFSADGGKFLSRSADSTLKLWDIRQLKAPVVRPREDLYLAYSEANATFSPDGTFILAGTTTKTSGGQEGGLAILETSSLETVQWVDTKGAGVIKVAWHPLINQIALGMTDGSCRILYEPSHLSQKGVMLCATRTPRRKPVEDGMVGGQAIITPFASNAPSGRVLHGYKRSTGMSKAGKRQQQLPEQPDAFGKGAGGKLGSSLTAQIMKGMIKDTTRDVDPREAILRYAEEAKNDPYWVDPAYGRKRSSQEPKDKREDK